MHSVWLHFVDVHTFYRNKSIGIAFNRILSVFSLVNISEKMFWPPDELPNISQFDQSSHDVELDHIIYKQNDNNDNNKKYKKEITNNNTISFYIHTTV